MSQVWVNFDFGLGKICFDFHLCCISGPAEVPLAYFREKDNYMEAETKRQRSSTSARITRSLVPLARGASAPINFQVESAVEFSWKMFSTMVCIY